MPDDSDSRPVMNPPPDGEDLRSFLPPSAETTCRPASQETRALVDGVGVYTASPSSPFLTAPLGAKGPSPGPESAATDPSHIVADQLTEPLRRHVQGLPLRLRLSEEELAGLIAAVLDVVARHVPIAYAEARRKH